METTIGSIPSSKSLLQKAAFWLSALIAFGFPLEYKYDKPLRRFSRSLIPDGVVLPAGFEKKIFFYASDIAAILLFLAILFVFKISWKRIFLRKENLFLWILFSSAVFSILISPLSQYPVIYTRLLQLLTPIFIYLFITLTPFSSQNVRLFLSLFVMTALVQSLFAVIQYFTQEPLGLRIFLESRDVPASFEMPDGRRWVFDLLFSHKWAVDLVKRASGTMNHSNILGGLLTLSILSSYSLYANAAARRKKQIIGALILFQFFALSTTYSRSAIFATLLGTVFWFGWAAYHRRFRGFAPLAGIAAVSFLMNGSLFFEQYLYRGGIVNYNVLVQNSDKDRLDAQSTAMQMMKDNPLFGVGFTQFAKTSSDSYVEEGARTPLTHNIYLLLSTEMGIFALLSFLGFVFSVLWPVIKTPFSPEIASLAAAFLGFLFIGFCDFYPIHLQEGKLMLFITAALLFVQTRNMREAKIS